LNLYTPEIEKIKSKLFKYAYQHTQDQQAFFNQCLIWCCSVTSRFDWTDHMVEVLNESMDDVLNKTDPLSSIHQIYANSLNTNEMVEKRLMETMQILVAIRLQAPELWEKVDKKRVKKLVKNAEKLKLGSAEFNDKAHLTHLQPQFTIFNIPKERHHF
jgi:predicted metal-binding transcription factor (methanogenesis marker protein 9)